MVYYPRPFVVESGSLSTAALGSAALVTGFETGSLLRSSGAGVGAGAGLAAASSVLILRVRRHLEPRRSSQVGRKPRRKAPSTKLDVLASTIAAPKSSDVLASFDHQKIRLPNKSRTQRRILMNCIGAPLSFLLSV